MTQEEKDLLIKDLCARLPYGIKCNVDGYGIIKLLRIEEDGLNTLFDFGDNFEGYPIQVYTSEIKPYLFPMSSMTELQKKEINENVITIDEDCNILADEDIFSEPVEYKEVVTYIDWLNEHHFDFRNLIERGLAIDCTNLNIY